MERERPLWIRGLYVGAGWVCLALGFLGVFLPLLPTTPLVLLAAFCFSRGSRRFHTWLLETRLFGPLIQNWQRHGVIGPRAKVLATIMLVALFAYTVGWVPVWWGLKVVLVLIAVGVLYFIWSRPSRTPGDEPTLAADQA